MQRLIFVFSSSTSSVMDETQPVWYRFKEGKRDISSQNKYFVWQSIKWVLKVSMGARGGPFMFTEVQVHRRKLQWSSQIALQIHPSQEVLKLQMVENRHSTENFHILFLQYSPRYSCFLPVSDNEPIKTFNFVPV